MVLNVWERSRLRAIGYLLLTLGFSLPPVAVLALLSGAIVEAPWLSAVASVLMLVWPLPVLLGGTLVWTAHLFSDDRIPPPPIHEVIGR